MNDKIRLLLICLPFFFSSLFAQELQVHTLIDLNASGGVTLGPDGHIYISDFGPSLGQASSNTKAYKMEYGTWEISTYASGFSGASGSRFDQQGNFYQSNPSGARVSKVSPDGTVNLNWASGSGFSVPIGIANDEEGNLYVCNCGNNTIRKINSAGGSSVFVSSSLLNCPNGLASDPEGNLYACNFNDGRLLKVTPNGEISVFATLTTAANVGNGHLTYSNGFLFLTTIGAGQVYKISLDGEVELIAGLYAGYSNIDGSVDQATFSKPNGIAASITGDTLFINCSVPTWASNPQALHPGLVRMITGVCGLPDVNCPLLSSDKNIQNKNQESSQLFPVSPNPVDEEAQLRYFLAAAEPQLQLNVYDLNMKWITSLYSGRMSAGTHQMSVQTEAWVAGVYFLVLEGAAFRSVEKMVVGR